MASPADNQHRIPLVQRLVPVTASSYLMNGQCPRDVARPNPSRIVPAQFAVPNLGYQVATKLAAVGVAGGSLR